MVEHGATTLWELWQNKTGPFDEFAQPSDVRQHRRVVL